MHRVADTARLVAELDDCLVRGGHDFLLRLVVAGAAGNREILALVRVVLDSRVAIRATKSHLGVNG